MKARRRLFYKYVIPIISIVVVALAASGGIGIYFSYKETRNALIALEREKAASAAMRIEQFVRTGSGAPLDARCLERIPRPLFVLPLAKKP